ncbi:MAG: radical SAM protein [Erysipelotrichaceae bacterium]|nr:radical SAM protein [Erysipelotrichaceae bacterium]
MNIYRGCSHGCIYCDTRSKCYAFDHDFEDIEVKINAPDLLRNALLTKRNKCMIGTGSMCDPYIHLEEELKLTRQCLEIIDEFGFGLAILTKSDRILRDIDLIESINRKSKAVVQMTLTTYDEGLCKKIEPRVSSTYERFLVLMECKKRNIPTVVWLSPILPFINDNEANLRGILDYCIKAGVKGIICFGFGLTLREGNREYFYKELDRYFPGLKEKYIKFYKDKYVVNSFNNQKLLNIFVETCRRNNIMYNPEEIFNYLREFPQLNEQLSIFDL